MAELATRRPVHDLAITSKADATTPMNLEQFDRLSRLMARLTLDELEKMVLVHDLMIASKADGTTPMNLE
jgi:hypothetical protein